jgi:hypothetical protein
MMKIILSIGLVATLGACDAHGEAGKKLDDAKYRATLESRGIGRFQLVQASGQYPAFVLDTVTGCLFQIHANENNGLIQKLPVVVDDNACLGDMPRDQEREIMETLKK